MKKVTNSIIATIGILLTTSTLSCDINLEKQLRYTIKSDRPLNVKFVDTLLAGEELLNDRKDTIGIFEEDKLIYSAIGSYHSGWFNAAVVVDTQTCEIDGIRYFAAE